MKNKTFKPSLFIILTYIIAQLFPVIALTIVGTDASANVITETMIFSTIFAFFIGAFLMIIINQQLNFQTTVDKQGKSSFATIVNWGIIGTIMAIAGQIFAQYIEFYVLNESLVSMNTETVLTTVKHYPYFIVIVSLFGPIMEEFVFRKVLFGLLYDYTGGIGAAVISSLIFAFAHVDGHILLYSILGMIFCFLYYKTKSITTPIIAHMLMNSLAFLGI